MRVNTVSLCCYEKYSNKPIRHTRASNMSLSNSNVQNFKGKSGQITGSILGISVVLLLSCLTIPALACLVAPGAAIGMLGGDLIEDKFKHLNL